jgi:hypothetical protein
LEFKFIFQNNRKKKAQKKLSDISLVVIGNVYNNLVEKAIEKTIASVPVKDVMVFSSTPIKNYSHYEIRSNFGRNEYNNFILKCVWPFVKTSHIVHIHYDGMGVNKEFWDDKYLEYDYIGAPWPEKYSWIKPSERVGNGGFSIRSVKLLEALTDKNIYTSEHSDRTMNEDAVICQSSREYLQKKYNINFAPLDLASKFSNELTNFTGNTLGFHGLWNSPLYLTENDVILFLDTIVKDYWSQDRIELFVSNCYKKNYREAFNFLKLKMCGE